MNHAQKFMYQPGQFKGSCVNSERMCFSPLHVRPIR